MRSIVSLLFACTAINAFALQVSQQTISEKSAPPNATTSILPSVTFSSVGIVSTVQMTGTATWTYGSDQQTGTVTLNANANGESKMLLQMSLDSRVETQNSFSVSQRRCTWSGTDSVVHNSAVHHCWVDAIWFLPGITMQTGGGAPDEVAVVAQSTDPSRTRIHRERHVVDVSSAQEGQFIAHLSAVDLEIDTLTGLPSLLVYAAHPDNDAGVDLAVEIRFSAYRNFSGVTVPTHIQKFINHTLVLDFEISNVQVQLASTAPAPSPIR